MAGKVPVKATGTGGRQARVDKNFGNIYDHFAIEFEYETMFALLASAGSSQVVRIEFNRDRGYLRQRFC